MDRRDERGFTLIELMVTVAIIALLAGIAVPAFFGESRKQRAKSEIGAMFGELAVREDQWFLEYSSYLTTPACPAAPASQGQDPSPCIATGLPWASMRVRIQESKLYCSYATFAGTGTGTINPSGFTFASPVGNWFYILATCDMDGDPTLDASYFTSSTDTTIQSQNDGH